MFIQYISGFWELSLQHLYFSKYSSLIKCVCEHVYTVYIRILGVCTRYNKLLNGFVDGNFKCEFYTFIRPNQEQLQKMQLYIRTVRYTDIPKISVLNQNIGISIPDIQPYRYTEISDIPEFFGIPC